MFLFFVALYCVSPWRIKGCLDADPSTSCPLLLSPRSISMALWQEDGVRPYEESYAGVHLPDPWRGLSPDALAPMLPIPFSCFNNLPGDTSEQDPSPQMPDLLIWRRSKITSSSTRTLSNLTIGWTIGMCRCEFFFN